MEKPNDIICHWRDANTDPPPEGRTCEVRCKSAGRIRWLYRHGNRWVLPGFTMPTPLFIESGDQWLDVTDRPAVPRAQVQAAVDEMTVRYWDGAECILHEVGERDHCEGCVLDQYPLPLCKSLACVANHTGVTPTEVTT